MARPDLLSQDLSSLACFVRDRNDYLSNVRNNVYSRGSIDDRISSLSRYYQTKNRMLDAVLREELSHIREDGTKYHTHPAQNQELEGQARAYVVCEQRKNHRSYTTTAKSLRKLDSLLQEEPGSSSYAPLKTHARWYERRRKKRVDAANELLKLGYNIHDREVVAALADEQKKWNARNHSTTSLRDALEVTTNYARTQKTNQRSASAINSPSSLKEKHELALKAMAYARSTYFTGEQPLLDIPDGRVQALSYIRQIEAQTRNASQTTPGQESAINQLEKFGDELELRASIEHHQQASMQSTGIFSGAKKIFHKIAAKIGERKLLKKHNQKMKTNRVAAKK